MIHLYRTGPDVECGAPRANVEHTSDLSDVTCIKCLEHVIKVQQSVIQETQLIIEHAREKVVNLTVRIIRLKRGYDVS